MSQPIFYDTPLDDTTSETEFLRVRAIIRLAEELRAKVGVPYNERIDIWSEVKRILERQE